HIYLSAISFLLPTHPHTRALHSFPTRRSSDLRKEQARARAHEHTGDFRKLTQYLQHVRAKGHVRNQPGLKIAVAQERNLPQKVQAQAQFEMPPKPQKSERSRPLQGEHPG